MTDATLIPVCLAAFCAAVFWYMGRAAERSEWTAAARATGHTHWTGGTSYLVYEDGYQPHWRCPTCGREAPERTLL